jgi:hypothetical protein
VAQRRVHDAKPLSLGELFDYLAPGAMSSRAPPIWPPDAYALAASALQRSDGYACCVRSGWPRNVRSWARAASRLGKQWRRAAVGEGKMPQELLAVWRALRRSRGIALDDLQEHPDVCRHLLQLIAAADEASQGVGLSQHKGWEDPFWAKAILLLLRDVASLGEGVHPSRAVVLPKIHTPRSGITLRSISHHLALCPAGEVTPHWRLLPLNWLSGAPAPGSSARLGLRLLLLPWPEVVLPSHFQAVLGKPRAMADGFGFFACDTRTDGVSPVDRAVAVAEQARAKVGSIDGIVFPRVLPA